jgi:hypothetical protein
MALIQVALGGETKFTPEGLPYNPSTEFGFMEETELKKVTSVLDNDNEHTEVTEYWEGDVLRHRSVNMVLKKPLIFEGAQGKIG